MEIQFRYSIDHEVTRVINTLEKLLWYREQGYRPTLPKGTSERSSREEIASAVGREYRGDQFIEAEQGIRNDFSEYLNTFLHTLRRYSDVVIDHIVLKLTRYGTSGSYQIPNFIVFDITDARGIKTIYHEVAHLVFEREFIQCDVSHWHRERIIDMLLHSDDFAFLEYSIWQRDYHGADVAVDDFFAKYFLTDREEFYRQLCGRP